MELERKRNLVEEEESSPSDSSLKRTRSSSGKDAGTHRELEERLVFIDELHVDDVAEFVALFADRTLAWTSSTRRCRSAALLFSYVMGASLSCREELVSLGGLELLGEVLREAVTSIENSVGLLKGGDLQEDPCLHALASMKCLRSLPLTEAPTEEGITHSLARLQVLRPTVGSKEPALGCIADLSELARELSQRWQCMAQINPLLPPAVTEPQRIKATDLIAEGLLGSPGARALAEKVEIALFALHGSATPVYRQHARMLKSNLGLSGNADLRSRLLSETLAVEKLVAMGSAALAPAVLQEERRVEQEKALRQTLLPSIKKPVGSDGGSTPAVSDGERTPKPSPSL